MLAQALLRGGGGSGSDSSGGGGSASFFHSATASNSKLVASSHFRVWSRITRFHKRCSCNARNGSYADIHFSSGQFTCNFSTRSDAAYAAFDQTAISNNHLLTDHPEIAKKLHTVRVGDQIRFRGHLAEYAHQHGLDFRRGTSTVRTDTGNGACETVFIDSIEIIRAGGKPWRTLVWVSSLLLALGVFAWFARPVRLND